MIYKQRYLGNHLILSLTCQAPCASSLKCNLIEEAGVCRSQCQQCGVAGPGATIAHAVTLRQFAAKAYTTILGDLTLSLSDASVSDAELVSAFQSVSKIQGSLIVRGSSNLVSLDVFRQLRYVGNITLVGNVNLVDARLPELQTRGSVVIEGNPRLCQAWLPGAPASSSPAACTNVAVTQHYTLTTPSAGNFAQSMVQDLRRLPAGATCPQVGSSVTLVTCLSLVVCS